MAGLGIALAMSSMTVGLVATPSIAMAAETQQTGELTADETVEVSNATDAFMAVAQAPTDGTVRKVVLTADITEGFNPVISVAKGANVILDLNGHTLNVKNITMTIDTENRDQQYKDTSGVNRGTLVIQNGTIASSVQAGVIANFGTMTVEKDVTITHTDVAGNTQFSGIANIGGDLVMHGTIDNDDGTGIVVSGGNVTFDGNIDAQGGIDLFTRNLGDDKEGEPGNLTVTGGTIKASNAYAIDTNNIESVGCNATVLAGDISSVRTPVYWPSSGTLTIGDKLTGKGPNISTDNGSGIEICAGTLDLYGGNISGQSTEYPSDSDLLDQYAQHSGTASMGDGITVVANRSTGYAKYPLSVNIHGGTISSNNNYGVRYLNCDLNRTDGSKMAQQFDTVIDGGTFTSTLENVDSTFSGTLTDGIIKGGTFNKLDIDVCMADGFALLARDGGTFNALPEVQILGNGYSANVKTDDGVKVYFPSKDAADKYVLEATGNGTLPEDTQVEVQNYTVTFNDMITGKDPVSFEVPNGTKLSDVDHTVPSFDGYEFAGWYDNADMEGDPIDLTNTQVLGGDVTLYAKWQTAGAGEQQGQPDGNDNENVNDNGNNTDETTDGKEDTTKDDAQDFFQTGVESVAAPVGITSFVMGAIAVAVNRISKRK